MTREETVASVERRRLKVAIDDDNADIVLAATLRETDALIGSFLLRLVSREHRQGEIGYMLNPSHHGHGYATEGAARMLQLGFEWLELHRIVARLDARNDASARLAERLGMRREAHLRENEFVKGEWVDELVYAILRTEWLSRR
jgi:RimJ/RimL family protein N-acetyltransferase